jgi:hypothetical protein
VITARARLRWEENDDEVWFGEGCWVRGWVRQRKGRVTTEGGRGTRRALRFDQSTQL